MIEDVGRRLVSAIDRHAGVATLSSAPLEATSPGRIVDFLAYSQDCLLVGRLRLEGDRLTDLLNQREEFEVLDVAVERLSDGQAASAPGMVVTRDELLVVQAAGPRGDVRRRHRTRPYPVAVQVGPYRVRGQLHAMPGVDPEVVIHRRAPMVPLTDAWMDMPLDPDPDLRRLGTVVLNRDWMDWVVATWDDSSTWVDESSVEPLPRTD